MCTNYRPSSRDLVREMLQLGELPDDLHWKAETWKDYPAPIVRKSDTGRDLRLATFGMVPRKRIPQGVKVFDTMNARFETVGEKRSFSGAWKRSQHCLVPMAAFYEPCYESGKAVRWTPTRIGTGALAGAAIRKVARAFWPNSNVSAPIRKDCSIKSQLKLASNSSHHIRRPS